MSLHPKCWQSPREKGLLSIPEFTPSPGLQEIMSRPIGRDDFAGGLG